MCHLVCWTNLIISEQNHVCKFLAELSDAQREALENDIEHIDMFKLQRMIGEIELDGTQPIRSENKPTPILPEYVDGYRHSTNEQMQQYYDHGLKLISEGQVGIVILAGGQGTRLGVDYPKGMYNIGLNSNKTLFQLQIESLLRLIHLANSNYGTTTASITCFIMTSEATNTMTVDFFRSNKYFGFNADDIIIFEQSQLPCIDRLAHKIILSEKYKIAFAPTGNGGFYDCLLDDPKFMEVINKRNLVGLHVYCVDNVLVKAADPYFVGCCDMRGVDCGNKVIERINTDEPLGVFCEVDNVMKVVEYSEMKYIPNCFDQRNASNELQFKYGNICNHYFSTKFLEDIIKNRWNEQLPIHLAFKKVPFIDLQTGEKITPDDANGIKFEKFIFDINTFAISKNVCLFNVSREDEFSPLKNANGKDSAETCLVDLLRCHYKLKHSTEENIPNDVTQLKAHEISPLDFHCCQ